MKARRAERGGDVAVLEDEEPEDAVETPAAALEEDLHQLESAYASWHVALERLWELEAEGPLSIEAFTRKQWLEYQMVQNLKTQEQLRPQLAAARLRERVFAAQAQHDALVPLVVAQAEAVVQALAQLTDALQALRGGFTAQVDGFFPFRDVHGHQAIDVADGDATLVQFLQGLFPGDFRANELVHLLRGNPLTVGRAQDALEACPRCHVFPPRVLQRYLATMEGK